MTMFITGTGAIEIIFHTFVKCLITVMFIMQMNCYMQCSYITNTIFYAEN